MIVSNVRVPLSATGEAQEVSPWVTVGVSYPVLSVHVHPINGAQIQLLTDDRHTLGWFAIDDFRTVDTSIPKGWVSVLDEGVLELGPAAWLAPGFWEAYYDGDEAAIEAVRHELRERVSERLHRGADAPRHPKDD